MKIGYSFLFLFINLCCSPHYGSPLKFWVFFAKGLEEVEPWILVGHRSLSLVNKFEAHVMLESPFKLLIVLFV